MRKGTAQRSALRLLLRGELACASPAWGEPARPGVPSGGTGKGGATSKSVSVRVGYMRAYAALFVRLFLRRSILNENNQ